MNPVNVRFGNIGVIYGPKEKAQQLLQRIGHNEGDIYYAENWSERAKSGDSPVFAYVTGEHLKDLDREQPAFDALQDLYRSEFKEGSSMRGSLGETGAVSQCRSGKGVARVHRLEWFG